MGRPARAGASGTGLRSSGAGRSAYARWLTERASHRRRHAVSRGAAAASVGAAVCAGLALVSSRPGVAHRPGGSGPLAIVLAAAAVVCLLVAVAVRPRPDPERWRRGAEGELATAELLAGLNPRKWEVWHDVGLPHSRANVDHLVIGPTGVWVVDTKAFRAPVRARRGRLWAGGQEVATDVVAWEAEVVAGVLGQSTRALIAVHGRGLPRRGRVCHGIRALPAEALVRRLRRGALMRPGLSRRRVRELTLLAASALAPRTASPRHADRQGPSQVISK
jgi:hypothetical protein